jgi:hypothetical protein
MIKIDHYNKLKTAPKKELVYVITSGKLYRNLDGEWVEKVYFTTKEVAQVTGIAQDKVRQIIRKLNLRSRYLRTKSLLDKDQLRLIAEASGRLNNKQTYAEIIKEMRL